MIGIVDVLKRDRCLNCNEPVSLLKSDIERVAHWSHDPLDGEGRYYRHCRPNTVASPLVDPEPQQQGEQE